MRGLYKITRSIISKEQANQLCDLLTSLPKNGGDRQVPKSHSLGNINAVNMLQGQLLEKLSNITKKRLLPTYTYSRIYLNGAELTPHKDRPSCEYSVTINLYKTHPWPIYMNKTSIELEPGDGVVYKGCEIEHSRKEFKGDEYIQIFLHYVDADGPYKDHIYDRIECCYTPEETFQFMFDDGLISDHLVKCVRVEEGIPSDVISKFLEDTANVKFSKGQIGNSSYEPHKRISDVFWVPKTQRYRYIYELLFKLVSDINTNLYKFRLTHMEADIQYTVYNSNEVGHYGWHTDLGLGNNGRKLSVVVQLSDPGEYEGGDLEFNNGSIDTVMKKKGSVVIFPSYLLHRVTPVTKGTRRTLVLWINGPTFS